VGIARNLYWALGGALLRPEGPNSKPKAKSGGGVHAPSPTARDLEECCKLLQQGSGAILRPQMHFVRTESPENASSGCKC